MSNEEKKFDDLLSSKLSEREFFFDELNWAKAEQAIVKEQARKKQKRTALIFLGGFLLGSAIMFPVVIMLNGTKQNTASVNTPTSQNDTKGQTASANNVLITQQPGTNATELNNPSSSTPVEEGNKNAAPINSSSSDKNAPKPKTNTPATNENSNYAYVRPGSEVKHKKHPGNTFASINRAQPQITPTNYHASGQPVQNQVKPDASTGNSMGSVPVGTNIDKGSSQNTNNAAANTAQQNNNAPNTQSTNVNANNVAANTNTQSSNVTAPQTAATNTSTATANNTKPGKDTAKNAETAPTSPLMPSNPTLTPSASASSTVLSVDAGAGYAFGWKSNEGNGGNGISPVIGLRLSHFFNARVGIYIGVRYNSLTNINSAYSSTDESYSFGLNNSVTSVSPQMLHYLSLPAGLQFNLDANDALSFGGNLLYLINANSQVTTSTQDALVTPTNQKKTAWGYTDGFNSFDAQLVIAYRRKLFASFGIAIEGYYGLMDIEENSFFMNNSFERNSGVRLVLSYDIIK